MYIYIYINIYTQYQHQVYYCPVVWFVTGRTTRAFITNTHTHTRNLITYETRCEKPLFTGKTRYLVFYSLEYIGITFILLLTVYCSDVRAKKKKDHSWGITKFGRYLTLRSSSSSFKTHFGKPFRLSTSNFPSPSFRF